MGVEQWLGGEKREVKSLLIKIGAAASLSFAGYLFYSHERTSGSGEKGAKDNPKERLLLRRLLFNGPISSDSLEISQKRRNSRKDGEGGFHDLKLENSPQNTCPEDEERKQEIAYLKGLVQSLQERERILEDQLLKYYGIKEQESIVEELQSRLNISAMEAELLSVRIDLLQAEKKKLEEQLADYSATKAELESAKGKMSNLKRKLEIDSTMAKEIISALREKVSTLRDQESRLEGLSYLEREVAELREMNSTLMNSQEESAEKILLKQRNDELEKQIEQLQSDRCSDAEELVYLKWINACLRYELRNYKSLPGKTTSRDQSKTLSPKSEQKVKHLIKDYSNLESKDRNQNNLVDFEWESCSSSQASLDDVSADATSATKIKKSGKTKFLAKLKSFVLRKDSSESPKSVPNSAKRSTISNSWHAEGNYDHQQEIDSSWTRNLSRISQNFRRNAAVPEGSAKKSTGRSRSLSFTSGGNSFFDAP